MMDIISCKEAIEKGLKHYFTGKPCKRGHIVFRNTNGRCCLTCDNERRKRAYRLNPEKIKAIG